MILLSSIIQTFEAEFLANYQSTLLPGQRKALTALKQCRTTQSPVMLAQCDGCDKQIFIPHSCGHRNCPHCQHHESQQWLERQLNKQVPAEYFLLTFTLPAELRPLAWQHQRLLYDLMIRCSWETLKTFAQNDPQLQGKAGAISVLHTHSRRLDYHPHVHVVMPAATIDTDKRRWRTKTSNNKKAYLFNHKALAKVFRAKLLDAITQEGLELPARYPESNRPAATHGLPDLILASSQFLVRIDNENKRTMASACGSLAREWLESGGLLSPARSQSQNLFTMDAA